MNKSSIMCIITMNMFFKFISGHNVSDRGCWMFTVCPMFTFASERCWHQYRQLTTSPQEVGGWSVSVQMISVQLSLAVSHPTSDTIEEIRKWRQLDRVNVRFGLAIYSSKRTHNLCTIRTKFERNIISIDSGAKCNNKQFMVTFPFFHQTEQKYKYWSTYIVTNSTGVIN